jgi:hypothetical protein
MASESSLRPTRKWWAARITAVGTLLVLYVTAGEWSTEVSVALIGLLVEGLVSWLVPNEQTPGGVPLKR